MVRIFLIGAPNYWQSIITEPDLFFLSLCTALIAAGGYVINDYHDIKIDMINKPEKVILGRKLSRRMAIIIYIAFNILAISISVLFLTIRVALFNLTIILLLWLYAIKFKKTAFKGNLIISILTFASIFIFYLYYKSSLLLIMGFSIFAFFISLIREVIKDMEDVNGDIRFGCNTLPIVYGYKKTKVFLLFIIGLFTCFLLFYSWYINKIIFVYNICLVCFPLFFLAYRLYFADRPKSFNQLSALSKTIMLTGIIGMLFV